MNKNNGSGHSVQGYSFEVVVTAPAKGVSWPLVASVDTASRAEQKTVLDEISELPKQTRYVLADAGYDSNAVGEMVEWNGQRRTGRRWHPTAKGVTTPPARNRE